MITALIIIGIFSLLIFLYWLSGLTKERRINPKKNRWHAWGAFDQVFGFIDGDKESLLPKSMPWPFKKVYFTMSYTQFVDDGDLSARKVKSADGKNLEYHEAQKIEGVKKPIRTVTEEITRIRKVEIHPYTVKVTLPKAGGTFYLVFTVKVKMQNPMDMLNMDQFLIFVGNQLHDAVFPWVVAFEKKIVETNALLDESKLKDTIIDSILGLSIDNDQSIMIGGLQTLKEYMTNVTAEYGGIVKDFSLDVGYDESIKKILEARNAQKLQEEETKKQELVSKTRDVTRKREVDDWTTERNQVVADREASRAQDLKDLELVEKPLIDAVGKAQADANYAFKNNDVVVLGGEIANNIAGPMIGSKIAKLAETKKTFTQNKIFKKQGGSNESAAEQ